MKRAYSITLCSVFLLAAAAAVRAETIHRFDTVFRVQQDGTVIVSETIEYDFEDASRHGIYRDIPVKYRSSYGNYNVRLSGISVTDENGQRYQFKVSNQGRDKRIRIGDPDVLISGAHTYVITYATDRAILFEESSDVFYWNATGNGWDVPIESATAQVVPPTGLADETFQTACYRGAFGSTEACDYQGTTPGGDRLIHNIAFSAENLGPGEGLTFKVNLPKGILVEPTALENAWNVVRDNAGAALPVLVFFIMLYVWRSHGRDPRGKGTIIAEYEPPEGMTPAQVGGLVDQHVHNKDIAGEIIELAVRGYLRIRQEEKKDYTFFQLKASDDSLTSGQKKLLEGLFGASKATDSAEPGVLKQVRLKDLREKFAATLAQVKAEFESSIVKAGHQTARPDLVRMGYVAFAFGIFMASFFLKDMLSTITFAGMLVSGAIIAGFGWAMPKRTYQGVLTTEKILGFKEYLRVVEKDRIKFHNAPEKKPELFEKFLPYAMVLGVEKEWAEQFKDMYTQEPQWYHGTPGAGFNSVIFANNMNSFASSAKSALAATPSGGTGGGGFSGGGFGGGGGGSW